MNKLGSWAAGLAQKWLDRFQMRHRLGSTRGPHPVTEQTGLGAVELARVLLHVGCGPVTIDRIPLVGFQQSVWREIRLDADPRVFPDIVGTMTNMSAVPDGYADAIYSSHNIEHLFPHEVPLALAEFSRTLKDEGFAVITCPDLLAVCRLVVEDKLDVPVYISDAGPIAPIDILYGHMPQIAAGNLFMAHRTGFTLTTLMAALRDAGFAVVQGLRREGEFALWALASKSPRTRDEMAAMVKEYLLTT